MAAFGAAAAVYRRLRVRLAALGRDTLRQRSLASWLGNDRPQPWMTSVPVVAFVISALRVAEVSIYSPVTKSDLLGPLNYLFSTFPPHAELPITQSNAQIAQ